MKKLVKSIIPVVLFGNARSMEELEIFVKENPSLLDDIFIMAIQNTFASQDKSLNFLTRFFERVNWLMILYRESKRQQ